jgi:hypothetical protein
MAYLFLFTIWEICLVGAFVGGYMLGQKRKLVAKSKEPTAEEKRAMRKSQKEFENFMNYSGVQQEVINDFE